MPVRSVRNQYRGVNAHLNSYLQAEGAWAEFHSGYLLNLYYLLIQPLLDMNYDAAYEPSLQIRRRDSLFDSAETKEPDLAIYDNDPFRSSLPIAPVTSGAVAERMLPIETVLTAPLSEKVYQSVRIYDRYERRGEPVVWIELLSPSNKVNRRDRDIYLAKRETVILSGIVFIEIDFLHESPPLAHGLPSYFPVANQDVPSMPYHIFVIDPRPNLRDGGVRLSEFAVDAPIPSLDVQLNDDDHIRIPFDDAYQQAYTSARYGLRYVDYAQFPVSFDHYREQDQARIANRMLAVVEAAREGVDLETAEMMQSERELHEALQVLRGY